VSIGGALALAAVGAFAAAVLTPEEPAPTSASPAAAPPAGGSQRDGPVDPAWVAETAAATGIPERALTAYADADSVARAEHGCTVGWNTLAGIGQIESHHGTLQGGGIDADGVARPAIIGIPLDGTSTLAVPDTDGGAMDGDAEWDRAVGPMQFIPETWSIWGMDADGDGVADAHDLDDAALTAAVYLCRSADALDQEAAWISAIRSYNDTDDYQLGVAATATRYGEAAG
jgi:membrane-bound lytic murein transglycosylase B